MTAPVRTLGAHRSHKGLCTTPDVETFYWLPCATLTPLRDERGRLVTHVLFITSNRGGTIFCPECRAKPAGQRAIRWDPVTPSISNTEDLPF